MKIIASIVLCFVVWVASVDAQQVTSGRLVEITKDVPSSLAPRKVHVWLPDGFEQNGKHDVLYMHDGQMLFDAKTTWNKQDWGVDEIAGRLINEQKTRPFIVVAIDNGGTSLRHSEYFPEKPLSYLTPSFRESLYEIKRGPNTPLFGKPVHSDDYLSFIVFDLKPYIDSNFNVNTGREYTFLMGSSMGGLISLYGVLEYPNIFGGSANMSTHWPGIFPKNIGDVSPVSGAFFSYIADHLPKANQHKIYFDYGDKTLDAFYPPLQKQVDKLFIEQGYDKEHFTSDFYPGALHDEVSWQKRLDQPLLFLFGKEK